MAAAEQPGQLTQHIETYVDVSRSPIQQAASLDAIACLVKKDVMTVEKLVREMEMYLTTTDNVIRARGILLLAEVLKCLEPKPLDDAIIHSLIGFFTDRLADWRALRGALVGCLALIRRKSSVGMVAAVDAHAIAKSYLQNLQVQSLAQYDRKLCFELLECLMQWYPEAVKSLGDNLIYGTCEAIDGEKDPQCLMLAFHIMEVLAQLFPDPSGPLAAYAADLFDVLGCYFPLHFTHKGEEADIERDDLSRALMLAFSSTPLFEPFAIPLLLEKLSSSLTVAKVDSLKYLNNCASKYGAERMVKHHGALWSSLKDAIFSTNATFLTFAPESLDHSGFQENEVVKEALNLLQTLVMQNISFLAFVVGDLDVKTIFDTISCYLNYVEMPPQSKQKLHAVSRILSICAKASVESCNEIFEKFFLRLLEIMGVTVRSQSGHYSPKDDCVVSYRLQHGCLYLSTELLAASRDFILGSKSSASGYAHVPWCSMLESFCSLLMQVFISAATSTNEDTRDADIYLGVKGLLILGTFPGSYSLVSKSVFGSILTTLMSIITVDFDTTLAWKLALEALVRIGLFVDQCHETEKALNFMDIVVDKIVSLASLECCSMPFSLKLEAMSQICTSGPKYMPKIIQGLEEALLASLFEIYVHGNSKAIETAVQLLECFSNKLLPRIVETGGLEEILFQFAVSIWDQINTCCAAFNFNIREKWLVNAAMMAMKLVVGICSVESQNSIIEKAYKVVSSSTLQLKESVPATTPVTRESPQLHNMSIKDDWILSLFASVIVAVHPQAHIPNVKSVIHLFIVSLLKGHVPSAQALGSMVNKLGHSSNGTKISGDCSLEEAINIIFCSTLVSSSEGCHPETSGGISCASDMGLIKLALGFSNDLSLQIHAITGLAWIGKGLLMRGHERVKDITKVFLECVKPISEKSASSQFLPDNSSEQIAHLSLMKCAADAFQILMCDSEACLNRKFHGVIQPLYKQRFFSTVIPILESLIMKSDSSLLRSMLYRASAHIVNGTPLMVILQDAKKLIPMILEAFSILSNDILDKEVLYSLLLVLSGILTDKNGQDAVVDSAHVIINGLVKLIAYPHMMLVRETAVQCLVAMAGLPHRRIYPLRTQVLQAISKALDDPKRSVRQEAVRCRQAWASIASRSLQF